MTGTQTYCQPFDIKTEFAAKNDIVSHITLISLTVVYSIHRKGYQFCHSIFLSLEYLIPDLGLIRGNLNRVCLRKLMISNVLN